MSKLSVLPKQTVETNSFKALIGEWLESCRAAGLSGKTLLDYEDKILKFWWWWDKHYAASRGSHPKNVTVKEARAFAAYLREPNWTRWGVTSNANNKKRYELSAASISSYGRTIKVFFNWLVDEGELEHSPFQNKTVKFTNQKTDKTIKAVAEEELHKLIAYLTQIDRLKTYVGCRDLAMLGLLIDSGIRRGELLSIQWADIELHKGICIVRGKTGKRIAHFGEGTTTALLAYYELRKAQGEIEGLPFWFTAFGKPLTCNGFQEVIRKIQAASGVKFYAHQLRHTFATTLALNGIGLYELKELMGHSSITTTQIYLHSNHDRLHETYKRHSPINKLLR